MVFWITASEHHSSRPVPGPCCTAGKLEAFGYILLLLARSAWQGLAKVSLRVSKYLLQVASPSCEHLS